MIFKTSKSFFKDLEKKAFNKDIWLSEWYPKICDYLEINPDDDSIALQKILSFVAGNYPSYGLKQHLQGKRIIAIAPGTNLEEEIEIYLKKFKSKDDILISADGATTYLHSIDIIPDIIVTDFDGNVKDQLLAQQEGSILLIHVHGDNYQTIQKYVPSISEGNFLLTTQTEALPGSHNFFGFTDGDRIVCLATIMNSQEIVLLGYDFGPNIGKYSKNGEIEQIRKIRKIRKFTIGKSIINWCHNSSQKITFISQD